MVARGRINSFGGDDGDASLRRLLAPRGRVALEEAEANDDGSAMVLAELRRRPQEFVSVEGEDPSASSSLFCGKPMPSSASSNVDVTTLDMRRRALGSVAGLFAVATTRFETGEFRSLRTER